MHSPHRPDVAALDTARLRLRRMVPDDLPELHRLHGDARVMATLGGVWSGDASRVGRFAVCGGLRCIVLDGREELELGYGLPGECWGRGLATELPVKAVEVPCLTIAHHAGYVLYRITRDAWQRRA